MFWLVVGFLMLFKFDCHDIHGQRFGIILCTRGGPTVRGNLDFGSIFPFLKDSMSFDVCLKSGVWLYDSLPNVGENPPYFL